MDDIGLLVIKATDPSVGLAEQHDAFGRLVRFYQDAAFACAFAYLRDFQIAEDAAQEAFISAWRKLPQLRKPEAFPGWLRRIVLTECNRMIRGKRLVMSSLACEDIPAGTCDPQKDLEQKARANAVRAAVGELPEHERVAVALFYINELSQNDTAAFLGLPVTTIAKRLHTARRRLKGKFEKQVKEGLMAHRPSRSRTFEEKVRDGIFDDYIGEYRYESRPDLTVIIKKAGNRLVSEAAGQLNELTAADDRENDLRAKGFDGVGRFCKNKKGRVTHFVYYEFGNEMGTAKKIN